MPNVEIQGLDKLKAVLRAVNDDMRPSILRDLARKPALKAASIARTLQPIGSSGATAKTIGNLKVKNQRQPYLEVGYRGRSLGHIYTSGNIITRQGRGSVRGFPWLFKRAGEQIQSSGKAEMKKDITMVFVRAFKKRGLANGI